MKKCIVMLSGGLDSWLAVKIMQEKGFDVIALYFKLPFSKDVEKEIKNFCKKEKVKLKVFDCTTGKLFQEYLDVIRKPKFGRGTCMNPCIDCRIFMLKRAKKFADSEGIELIVTGEVEGERPMSQHKRAMNLIEKESGLGGRLIRPLCEIGIRGRSRKKQIALAKKFKISYPHPAGGCLLCEKLYCEKLKNILNKKLDYNDIKLLSIGRHFENSEIILGRNKQENDLLEKEKGIKIMPNQPGATALVRLRGPTKRPRPPTPKLKMIEKAKRLIQKYSKHKIKGFEVKE